MVFPTVGKDADTTAWMNDFKLRNADALDPPETRTNTSITISSITVSFDEDLFKMGPDHTFKVTFTTESWIRSTESAARKRRSTRTRRFALDNFDFGSDQPD